MELHIEFFKDKESPSPISWATCDRNVPLDCFDGTNYLKGNPIKWNGSDTIYIEANINFEQENVDELFQLSLAFNPDYKPLSNERGRFFYEKKENGSKEKVYRMQLLRGAAGISYLRLLKRASTAAEFKEIVRYEIGVQPAPAKKKAMEHMVDELLKAEPTLAISTLQGLSKAPLKRKWISGTGSADLWRLQTKYDEMKEVIKELHPHLHALSNRYAMQLTRKQGKLSIDRVRKWSSPELRQLARDGGNKRRKIGTFTLETTQDIPIHCAIKDFLLRLKGEASEMIQRIRKSIDEGLSRQNELQVEIAHNDKLRSVYQYELQSIHDETETKYGFEKGLMSVFNMCQSFLADCYPWSGCHRLEVTALPIACVPNTSAYQQTYSLMLRYSQKKFFKEALGGQFLLPQYERDNNGNPSAWQKNYSYVYESWVFLRLAKAFQEEGFEDFGQSFRDKIKRNIKAIHLGPTVNEPIHATSRDGKLQVDLFHGIRAYHQSSSKCPEFFSVWKSKDKSIETPDFVIVFTNPIGKENHYFNWIVLDAKAWPKLGDDAIMKRDNYASTMRRWDKTVMPDQSWLVYSSELSEKDFPEIEFDPDTNDNLPSWDLDYNPLSANAGMIWHPDRGIEGWTNPKSQPCGHIRANIFTIGKHDIFRDFARGQIATARKRLGL